MHTLVYHKNCKQILPHTPEMYKEVNTIKQAIQIAIKEKVMIYVDCNVTNKEFIIFPNGIIKEITE